MNLLFLTQNKTLDVFYDVMLAIRKMTKLANVGFYVADSAFYEEFRERRPEICAGSYQLLKEWEIIDKSRHVRPDIRRIKEYERTLGDPVLWNALVADRRVYLGRRATLEQDYASRFSHKRMLAILQVGLAEMEAMFDRVQPDAVVGFICVTIGEYLAYLVANDRKIPFLNLRPTRIKNYFHAGDSIQEPSKKLEDAYLLMLSEGIPLKLQELVSFYLTELRETHAMYEGVLPPPGNYFSDAKGGLHSNNTGFLKRLWGLMKRYYIYNFGEYCGDNHHRGVFYPIWFHRVKRPIRLKCAERSLRPLYVDKKELQSLEYAFYPLHKEPEVTLLVYGRPYLNQIEVIRKCSMSLPVGMKLVVKEHPGALGYRPLSYYRKLLAIPNVLLAPPEMTSRELVENAHIVTVIAGSVGLEALMLKKPVVALGRVPFSIMPKTMIRYARNLDRLGWDIRELLDSQEHDELALLTYIAAVMDSSVPVDFYSTLIGREGVYQPDQNHDNTRLKYTTHIRRLAEYLVSQF